MTREHARKKAIRAQMAASGEPYSVAARKVEGAESADEAARREVIVRAAATLAASCARLGMTKEPVIEPPVSASAQEDPGPVPGRLMRLAARAWEFAFTRIVQPPERLITDPPPPPSGPVMTSEAAGVIEPAARRFHVQKDTWLSSEDSSSRSTLAWAYVNGSHYYGRAGRYVGLSVQPLAADGPDPYAVFGDDPLELLMRLQDVTAARYVGEETLRATVCRKFTVSDSRAEYTIWADGKHIRQVKTIEPGTQLEPIPGLVITIVQAVTTELWDFGPPSSSLDWTRFSTPHNYRPEAV